MNEPCFNEIDTHIVVDGFFKTPPSVECKYKKTCPKYKGFEPGWNKPKDFEKCRYYQKFEKENCNG